MFPLLIANHEKTTHINFHNQKGQSSDELTSTKPYYSSLSGFNWEKGNAFIHQSDHCEKIDFFRTLLLKIRSSHSSSKSTVKVIFCGGNLSNFSI